MSEADRIELRPIEGFPNFAIDVNRRVWSCRGRRGNPASGLESDWRPLRLSSRSDRGHATVILYREGEMDSCPRSVERLYAETWGTAPAPDHPGGPEKGPPTDERHDDDDDDDDAPEGGDVELAPIAPTSYRLIPGFEGYVIGLDRTVWSRRRGAWRLLAQKVNRGCPYVVLVATDGRKRQRTVNALFRRVWPDLPTDHPGGPSRLAARPRGQRHGRAKMTNAKVVELRRRAADGESVKRLALDFGISLTMTRLIIARTAWRHILDDEGGSPAPPIADVPNRDRGRS